MRKNIWVHGTHTDECLLSKSASLMLAFSPNSESSSSVKKKPDILLLGELPAPFH